MLKNALVIKRIYNWIDLSKFFPDDNIADIKKSLSIENKFIIISVASRWSIGKGIDQIIKIASENKDLQALIIGELVADVKLPDNIIHIDKTNSIEMLRKLYCIADVYVSFSKEESFGKTVAEALSSGTPAIVYNSTALPELVGEECGYSVNRYDEIINAIDTVRKNGKLFYSKRCREFAEKNFSMTENIKDYIDIYNELRNRK